MKTTVITLFVFFLLSCSTKIDTPSTYLQAITLEYSEKISHETNRVRIQDLKREYNRKITDYFIDSLGSYLSGLNVYPETIERDYVKFTGKDNVYYSQYKPSKDILRKIDLYKNVSIFASVKEVNTQNDLINVYIDLDSIRL